MVGPVDESDNEDRQREEQKRKNYDLLLKRRQSARNREELMQYLTLIAWNCNVANNFESLNFTKSDIFDEIWATT